MSLKQNAKKIKRLYQIYNTFVIWSIILILAVLNSYIFGFLSDYYQKGAKNSILTLLYDPEIEIKAQDIDQMNRAGQSGQGSDKEIVASKNGTKYYFIWCGGVGRINEENKVYFSTEAEAKESGYELAVNCQ